MSRIAILLACFLAGCTNEPIPDNVVCGPNGYLYVYKPGSQVAVYYSRGLGDGVSCIAIPPTPTAKKDAS